MTIVNTVDYITIGTAGNATDFGNLSSTVTGTYACASSTRALCAGGYNGSAEVNVIDYFTIASTGNATDFGDLRSAHSDGYAFSSATRACFQADAELNYVTISSTGNAADFGDVENGTKSAGASNAHGGLS
tara:strand:+ start:230 stop:622 length:393 start_codon:yes stop_codon:yes gene_type:complete